MLLTDHLYQSDYEKLKIKAAFFGVDIDKNVKEQKKVKKEENNFMFKDPKEYKDLSVEEKKELTEKMMGAHQNWADGKLQKG